MLFCRLSLRREGVQKDSTSGGFYCVVVRVKCDGE